jgi:hypothetical protein
MAVDLRRTSDPAIGRSPSRTLLPADGALAAEARRLIRRFADPALVPPSWSEAAFIREVGLVRAHLAPIRSRAGLAASFSREAFHAVLADEIGEAPGAVRVAYALRWLELGSGRTWPSWPPVAATASTPFA